MSWATRLRIWTIAGPTVLALRVLAFGWVARRRLGFGSLLLAAITMTSVLVPDGTAVDARPTHAATQTGSVSSPLTPSHYTVQPGDTLDRIAMRLHVPGGWKTLWRMNRDSITDPDQIAVHQILRLPRLDK